MDTPHIPVLLEGVLRSFESAKKGFFVDCTLGYGGHSGAILQKHPKLELIGIDRDQEALDFSAKRLDAFADRTIFVKGDFASVVPSLIQSPITAILADFGVSSLQLDKHERGFGFDSDMLDMRMDQDSALSAYQVVNDYPKERLEYIFSEYGEIRESAKLADAIVKTRLSGPIESAKALSGIAKSIIRNKKKIHPATLMFQAIRIEVNDELGQIEKLLDALEEMDLDGTIVSLITFHSLEDRLVKRRFRKWAQSCICDPATMRCTCGNNHSLGTIATRKPIVATEEELKANVRSRSAKLRTFIFRSN